MSPQIPTPTQMDDAALGAMRDILVDASSKFTPTVRQAILDLANQAMSHISGRLTQLQAIEVKTDEPQS